MDVLKNSLLKVKNIMIKFTSASKYWLLIAKISAVRNPITVWKNRFGSLLKPKITPWQA